MLIEAARRAEAAASEMLELVGAGAASCSELREMLAVSRSAMAALSAAQVSAAAAVAGRERHGDGGAEVLAGSAGLSRREARSHLKTAEALREAPAARDAVESGRVSAANARRLAEASETAGASAVDGDGELLAKAVSMRPEQFAREARRWVVDRDGDDGESQHRRSRARRCVRVWDGDDGMVHLRGELDPVTGRRVANRLRSQAARMHSADKKTSADGTGRRSFGQCMADALDALTATNTPTDNPHNNDTSSARTDSSGSSDGSGDRGNQTNDSHSDGGNQTNDSHSDGGNQTNDSHSDGGNQTNDSHSDGGNQTNDSHSDGGARAGGSGRSVGGGGRPIADICVVAHVDGATGRLVAELPDGTRLPRAVLEELSCNARLTGLVYDRDGKPIWRTHSVRTATESQRQILLARHGGCFHCAAHPALCQIHHIKPVAQGGSTKLDNMTPVCWDCHQKIHHHNWRIRKNPDGNHTLHPPEQTRHGPAHAPDPPHAPAPPPTSGHHRPATENRLFTVA